ncbi:MAG: L-threonylcarbamoyladenylate synthase [Patescibacteria group bacterium]|nr:L-threonylcarbamoyladenylate synthase [Patescibacteria group bacterium]
MNLKIIRFLKEGKIGVLPTDTLYGIVGSALNKEVVEKIYNIKGRTKNKPLIILISSLGDLNIFQIQLSDKIKAFLEDIWPNPISIILPCPSENFFYLHRGTKTLAFRIPNKPNLLQLLKKTGPLVAPSANPENRPPVQTLEETKQYFGEKVDFYLDGGKLLSQPSTLIKVDNGKITTLRQGVYKLK